MLHVVSAGDVFGAYMGQSERRLREAFEAAGRDADAGRTALIFLDEVRPACCACYVYCVRYMLLCCVLCCVRCAECAVCCAVKCCVVLCCTVLCFAALSCAVLCAVLSAVCFVHHGLSTVPHHTSMLGRMLWFCGSLLISSELTHRPMDLF